MRIGRNVAQRVGNYIVFKNDDTSEEVTFPVTESRALIDAIEYLSQEPVKPVLHLDELDELLRNIHGAPKRRNP